MRVKRVVEKRRSLEDVGVVLAYLRKTLADGPQIRRLGGDVHLRRKVRAVDDPGESPERLVARKSLVDKGLKRAAAALVAVAICRFRRVEADGSFALLNCGHLLGFDEEDLGLRIEKSSDQTAGGRPVDVDAFTRHPLH